MSFVVIFCVIYIDKKELFWDVFGYYLWLLVIFIYDDLGMKDCIWVEEVNKKYEVMGIFYQFFISDEGEFIYFFLMGMLIFYVFFFFLGYGMVVVLGVFMDGFSVFY